MNDIFANKAKKEFGQNFLVNEKTIERIINLIKVEKPTGVIEIGPGQGAFTKYFNTAPFKSISIEIDSELIPQLQSSFPKIQFLNQDFLQIDLSKLFAKEKLDAGTVFYGSLPYNISKQIIKNVTDFGFGNYKKAFFIIQKEVAEKFAVSNPLSSLELIHSQSLDQVTLPTINKKDKSTQFINRLSLLTSNFATVKKIFDISPGQFRPVPKVMSTVIEITPQKQLLDKDEFKKFVGFATTLFTQPRKTVQNNLKLIVQEFSKTNNGSLIDKVAPILAKRPEQLTPAEALILFKLVV